MRLAKPCLDVGLFTRQADVLVAWWRDVIGATFDHVLPIGDGHSQHRMDLSGSVLKINQLSDLPAAGPSGYREILVARDDIGGVRSFRDPDGNRVSLVPRGFRGIPQLAMSLGVRDVAEHCGFLEEALELTPAGEGVYRVGNSRILLETDNAAAKDSALIGPGWRYTTIQVCDAAFEHERFLSSGGFPGTPLQRLGDVAKFAMVRDPDGNWIELSQRASLTGPLGNP